MSVRLMKRVILSPLHLLQSTVKSTNFEYASRASRTQNIFLKSKLLLLIGLIFFGTNLLISSLIFNIDNYNDFVESTKNLNTYLFLHRNIFQLKKFVHKFSITGPFFQISSPQVYVDSNIVHNDFNHNLSSIAYLAKLTSIYESQPDPDTYLSENGYEIDFHWSDWVDTSPANAFVKSYDLLVSQSFNNDHAKLYETIRSTCFDKMYDVRDPWLDELNYEMKLSVFEHLRSIGICSAIFKYYYWTIPERVVFETDFKYFNVPVNQKRLSHPLGVDGLSKIYSEYLPSGSSSDLIHADRGKVFHDLETTYLQRGYKPTDFSLKPTLDQDPKNFKQPDFEKLLQFYETIEKPTKQEEKYLNFLRYSKDNVAKAERFYFTFPFLRTDPKAELHHYNFPWLKHIIAHEERIKVIHHLVRSWFKFAENAGVISWFNYGNLIGWYFNAQNLPWDNDVDVQMSINDVDKIGRYWNNTLIVENPNLGDALFWLQTDPFYLQQNDAQFIDARYIDVKSGIYIDISALWESDRQPEVKKPGEISFHCKHFNWFVFSDIFPLRRTLYEGAQAYMPNKIDPILKRFYKKESLTNWNIFDHNWQPDIGLWVPNQYCENEGVPKDRFDAQGKLTLHGACQNEELLEEWTKSNPLYELHKKEHQAIKKGKDSSKFSEKDLPIFRHFSYDDYR